MFSHAQLANGFSPDSLQDAVKNPEEAVSAFTKTSVWCMAAINNYEPTVAYRSYCLGPIKIREAAEFLQVDWHVIKLLLSPSGYDLIFSL